MTTTQISTNVSTTAKICSRKKVINRSKSQTNQKRNNYNLSIAIADPMRETHSVAKAETKIKNRKPDLRIQIDKKMQQKKNTEENRNKKGKTDIKKK